MTNKPFKHSTAIRWIKEIAKAGKDDPIEIMDIIKNDHPDIEWDASSLNNLAGLVVGMTCKTSEQPTEPESQDDRYAMYVSSYVTKDGLMYEQGFDPKAEITLPYFIRWDGNNAAIVPQAEEGGAVIYPINDDSARKGAVILPDDAAEYKDTNSLLADIRTHVLKYIDVDEKFLEFALYYILLSWVSDRLNTIPYLRALGDTGTGKSRVLDTIGRLCYKPIMIGGSVTPAAMYRIMERWKGTLLIDEADRKESDTTDDVIKVLNCGFERGRPIIRCSTENPADIETHDPFGPKVLTSRYRFSDKALESRCITTIMQETKRKDIPPLLPPSFYEEQRKLRAQLLMFRFRTRATVSDEMLESMKDIGMKDIEPRLRQSAAPFFVLLKDDNIKKNFEEFMLKYSKTIIQERADSLEGEIVRTIKDMLEEGTDTFSPEDIAEKINADKSKEDTRSAERIGKIIKSLGFEQKQRRILGRMKRVVIMDDPLLRGLYKRYIPDYKEEKEGNLEGFVG